MFSVKIDVKGLPEFIKLMEDYPQATDENIAECFDIYLNDVKRKAFNIAPVDTGRLRGNIDIELRKNGNALEGVIFNTGNVKYAPYVHEGTKFMKARPYLRQAIFNTKILLTRLLQQNFLKSKRKGLTGVTRKDYFAVPGRKKG